MTARLPLRLARAAARVAAARVAAALVAAVLFALAPAASAQGLLTEVEPNNTATTGMMVALGDSVKGAIDPAGDVDYYRVTVTAPLRLRVLAKASSSPALDGALGVYDASGTRLAFNDDFGGNAAQSYVEVDLPKAATYFVRYAYFQNVVVFPNAPAGGAGAASATGSYKLYVNTGKREAEPNNTATQATPLAVGDSVEASIGVVGDVDYYAITVTRRDTLLMYTRTSGPDPIDGAFWLYNASGSYLAYSDDEGLGSNPRLLVVLPSAGTYYLRYAFYTNGSGFPNVPARDGAGSPESSPADGLAADDRSSARVALLHRKAAAGPARESDVQADVGAYTLLLAKRRVYPPSLSNLNTIAFGADVETTLDYATNGAATTIDLDHGPTTALGQLRRVGTFTTSGILTYWRTSVVRLTAPAQATSYYLRARAFSAGGADTLNGTATMPAPGWTRADRPALPNEEYYFSDVAFASDGVAVRVHPYLPSRRTTDGGLTWADVPAPDGAAGSLNAVALTFTTATEGVAVNYGDSSQPVQIFRTRDAGATWTRVATSITAPHGLRDVAFSPTTPSFGVAVGNRVASGTASAGAALLVTRDGGATWTEQPSPGGSTAFLYSAAFSDDGQILLVSGNNGTLLRSADGGTTWSTVTMDPSVSTLAQRRVAFGPGGLALMANTSGQIARSTDGGLTWQRVAYTGAPAFFAVPSFASATTVYLAGRGSSGQNALRSDDGGLTWRAVETGTTASVYAVAVRSGTLLAAAGNHSVMRSTASVVDAENVDAADGATALRAPYPAPLARHGAVPFALARAGHVRLAVYDLLGRERAVLADGAVAAGPHVAPLDASALAPGLYVVRLVVEGGAGGRFSQPLVVAR